MSPQPETQHVPIPRATTAVRGHTAANGQDTPARQPCLRYLPGRFPDEPEQLFALFSQSFCSIVSGKTTRPQAAPGEAGSAEPTGAAFQELQHRTAGGRGHPVFLVRSSGPLLFRDHALVNEVQAICRAAAAVPLTISGLEHEQLLSSMVNSISCISL